MGVQHLLHVSRFDGHHLRLGGIRVVPWHEPDKRESRAGHACKVREKGPACMQGCHPVEAVARSTSSFIVFHLACSRVNFSFPSLYYATSSYAALALTRP